MRTIREIHEEIERLSEERVELWHQLSTEYDPQIREQELVFHGLRIARWVDGA